MKTLFIHSSDGLTTIPINPPKNRSGGLRLRAMLGYGVGETGLNLLVGGISSYLLFFYTEVFGITAGAAGLLILIARIWDAANDPIMGAIVDRTRSRWGQSRPYILFLSAPVAILTMLTFTTPPLGPTGRLVWAYATFILWGMAFTALAVPYNALMANLTTDFTERTSLGAVKTLFAVVGSLVVIVLAKPMTESLGGSPQVGFTATFAIFGILAFFLFLVCFALTEERPNRTAPAKLDLRQLRNVAGNRELVILLGFFLLFQVAFSLFRTIELFYFKYVLHREGWFAATMLLAHLSAVAGMAITPALGRRFGKKNASMLGGVAGCLLLVMMALVPGGLGISVFGISFSYLCLSVPYALFFGMVPDRDPFGRPHFLRVHVHPETRHGVGRRFRQLGSGAVWIRRGQGAGPVGGTRNPADADACPGGADRGRNVAVPVLPARP
jgi:sugar (glycoside-pentoside-hexuronide) transporter